MKKILLLFIIMLNFSVFAQINGSAIEEKSNIQNKIPFELLGVWEGKDRFIFFDSENNLAIAHKMFYGWYTDISASSTLPENFSKTKNDASSQIIQKPIIKCSKLTENSLVFELEVQFSKNHKNLIPLCIIDDKIYLDFLYKTEIINENNDFSGFYQGVNAKNTIGISEEIDKQNVQCFYIDDSVIYNLHFWKTDMDYEKSASVTFNDSEKIFKIQKHIKSAENIYTCATGKRKRIRNVEKFTTFPDNLISNKEKTVISTKSEDFRKILDLTTVEEFIEFVNQQNLKIHKMKKYY